MPSCKPACAASLIAYVDNEDAETWGENTLQHFENCSLCGMFDELKRVDIRQNIGMQRCYSSMCQGMPQCSRSFSGLCCRVSCSHRL